ncbi:hypothetical protein SFUMM280S_10401 [Streptomyces fumanus]
MIPCPTDIEMTERGARGRTSVPLGAHARSRGTRCAITRRGQPPSAPPASGEGVWATIVSVLRWITP